MYLILLLCVCCRCWGRGTCWTLPPNALTWYNMEPRWNRLSSPLHVPLTPTQPSLSALKRDSKCYRRHVSAHSLLSMCPIRLSSTSMHQQRERLHQTHCTRDKHITQFELKQCKMYNILKVSFYTNFQIFTFQPGLQWCSPTLLIVL